LCSTLSKNLQTPVLIIYYPDNGGSILEDDVEKLYSHLRECELSSDKPLENLTVVLHTAGGDPDAAYHLAQIVRKFTNYVYLLVPYMAASAGTIFSFCANKIYLGSTARLGAIDVSVGNVELASIIKYIKFALDVREDLEGRFRNQDHKDKHSSVESDLLVELVRQIKAIDLGSFYRNSTISVLYSVKLMTNYLFSDLKNRHEKAAEIAHKLTNDIPAHDFVLDYHMCKDIGLPVDELREDVSDMIRNIVTYLHGLTFEGVICKDIAKVDETTYKDSFFRFYPLLTTTQDESSKNQ